jgi:hypothetical protein
LLVLGGTGAAARCRGNAAITGQYAWPYTPRD